MQLMPNLVHVLEKLQGIKNLSGQDSSAKNKSNQTLDICSLMMKGFIDFGVACAFVCPNSCEQPPSKESNVCNIVKEIIIVQPPPDINIA
jgi:hypothetical protein